MDRLVTGLRINFRKEEHHGEMAQAGDTAAAFKACKRVSRRRVKEKEGKDADNVNFCP
jgi:hypothetical protein